MSHKVILIGLDGGTFRILNPLMENGKLPNITRLVQAGSRGTLLSTIPPVTAPAWTSLLTGKNPGKHGIFNFLRTINKTYTTRFYDWNESVLVNATDIHSKTLWELAGECGKRVGVINMPMTYPPMPINGFMITCMLTPLGSSNFTYPLELASEIPDYKIDLECGRGYGQVTPAYVQDYKKFFSDLTDVMDRRAKSILHLMKNHPWDLLMPVFTETDRIHHYFWRCMDKNDPFSGTEDGKAQRELFVNAYQRLDAHIGSIINAAGDAVVIVISDHGFSSGAKYHFHLNSWLRQKGYLLLDGDPVGKNVSVSWGRTKAWGIPYLARTGGIKINIKGEMEYGIVPKNGGYEQIVNKLRQALKEIRDHNGLPVVEKVYLRGELYDGEFSSDPPDILFTVSPEFEIPLNFQTDVGSQDIISTIQHRFLTGNHEREGILLLSGGTVIAGSLLHEKNIEDVAPTVLHLLGLPVPEDMDGKVITDALDPEYMKANPVRYVQPNPVSGRGEGPEGSGGWESAEEMQEVKARLRGLGYME